MDTDHYLSIAKIRARISVTRSSKTHPTGKYNVDKLKETEVCTAYQNGFKEEFIKRTNSPVDTIEGKWKKISEALKVAAERTIGFKKRPTRSSWFDNECLEVTARKNEAYIKMLQRRTRQSAQVYGERRREEKRLHRKKKRAWEDQMFKEVETFKNKNESRLFFQRVNERRTAFTPVTSCWDEDGTLLVQKDQVLQRWV